MDHNWSAGGLGNGSVHILRERDEYVESFVQMLPLGMRNSGACVETSGEEYICAGVKLELCTLKMSVSTRSAVAAVTASAHRDIPKQYFAKKGKVAASNAVINDKTSSGKIQQAIRHGTGGCVPVSLDSKRSGGGYSREVEFNSNRSDDDKEEEEEDELGCGGEVGHAPCKDGDTTSISSGRGDDEESDREGTGLDNAFDSSDDEDDRVEEIGEMTRGVKGGSRWMARPLQVSPPNVGGDAWAGDITSEKCLMAEVGNLFRRKKFFGSEAEMESDSPVAHFFYDKLKIAECNRKRWWKEVQWKIRKKLMQKGHHVHQQ